MPRINLLPWRAELRKQKQKEFLTQLALIAGLGLAVVVGGHAFLAQKISHQQDRNNRLQKEIKRVDQRLAEIKELEVVKKALVDRMEVIQQLQESRPEVVHLFDDIVNTLPEGMFLTRIEQAGAKLSIEGKSESNARVSTYMRKLDDSLWLSDAKLLFIEAKKEVKGIPNNGNIRSFSLEVMQSRPEQDKETSQ